MLEVTVGKDGVHGRIGEGGTNISMQNLSAAYGGVKEAAKVTNWKYGSKETGSTLSSINMLGYTNDGMNNKVASDIWGGKLKAAYGDTGNDLGYYETGGDTITLSRKLLGGGKEGSAELAAVMAHEGTHANGNRVEGLAHMQALGTYMELEKTFKLSGNSGFTEEMAKGVRNADNWVENTGNVDHWKVMKNGDIKDDGEDGKINFEDGRETIKTKAPGKQPSLEEYLGIDATDTNNAYSLLLKKAGYTYTNGRWSVDPSKNPDKILKAADIAKVIESGKIGNTDYANEGMLNKAGRVIGNLARRAGQKIASTGKQIVNDVKDLYCRMTKTGIYSNKMQELKNKFDDVDGLPYSENYKVDEKLDKNGVITAESTGMNCIGFVCYMFGISADNSVENFENYSQFKKLKAKSEKDLQPGDVIRWRAKNAKGKRDDHVQIWAGSGKVWESVSSERKNGVRYDDLFHMSRYYSGKYVNDYQIDYFRYKKGQ